MDSNNSLPDGYPCPCCGHLTRSEKDYGTYEICEVCRWEDDPLQAEQPDFDGGANIPSLNQARKNYELTGCSDPTHPAKFEACRKYAEEHPVVNSCQGS